MTRQTLRLKKSQQQIPDTFFSSNISSLEIFGDSLTELPDKLALLPQLLSLSVISKNLTTISAELFKLPLLHQLKIKFGLFEKLPAINSPSSLKTIFLTDSKLLTLPQGIEQCAQLEILVLNSNQLSSLPNNLSLLKNLRRLVLDKNQLTEFNFSRADFPKLNHLSLEGNQFSPSSKQHIKQEFGIEL